MYGARDFKPSPWSKQDLVSADWRLLHYRPEHSGGVRDGLGVMAAILSANILLSPVRALRLIFNHDLGGFSGEREIYLQARVQAEHETGLLKYIQAGRFTAPFGFRTDEHRTYTRVITQTTWLDLFEGINFSSDFSESLHGDLSLVNGDATASRLSPGKSSRWGAILNLRSTPVSPRWPLILGFSTLRLNRSDLGQGEAHSIYGLFSFDRGTYGRFPLTLSAEAAQARRMNGSNAHLQRMIESSYLDAIANEISQALLLRLDWRLGRRWTLTCKFDEMILDTQYLGDFYRRLGLGFRYDWAPNAFLLVRSERGEATAPAEADGQTGAAQDALWVMVKVAF